MEKRKCVSCSKEFTITDKEILFYRSRGLELPKHCEACRRERRQATIKQAKKKKSTARVLLLLSAAVLIAGGIYRYMAVGNYTSLVPAAIGALLLLLFLVLFVKARKKDVIISNAERAEEKYEYAFRTSDDLLAHYQKHGYEVGAKNPDEYLKKANAVITSPKSIKKREKEDNDLIYFNPGTGEIVFMAEYGAIRSYYISDMDYYNRQ